MVSEVPMTKRRSALLILGIDCESSSGSCYTVSFLVRLWLPSSESNTHRLPEKHDVRLHEPCTRLVVAVDDLRILHDNAHLLRIIFLLAVDAVLRCEASVGLYKPIEGNTGLALEGIDVLREARVEQPAIGEQLYEGVGQRWPKPAGIQFMRQGED